MMRLEDETQIYIIYFCFIDPSYKITFRKNCLKTI